MSSESFNAGFVEVYSLSRSGCHTEPGTEFIHIEMYLFQLGYIVESTQSFAISCYHTRNPTTDAGNLFQFCSICLVQFDYCSGFVFKVFQCILLRFPDVEVKCIFLFYDRSYTDIRLESGVLFLCQSIYFPEVFYPAEFSSFISLSESILCHPCRNP